LLEHFRSRSRLWGNGHIPLFIAVVAVGGGLHLAAYAIDGQSHLGPVPTLLAIAIPLAAYAVLIYALFGSLTRALTRRHLWQLAASLAVALLSVVLVALGSPLSVGLVVLSFVPWVTVIAQERDARRKELSSDALALGASPHHRRV
ncbi:MAG TPA: low temperature requirement protein A, partial [Dermatophilaceae bacterium]|nr:low temperature requirement protein A [Dermatophilaceae bacterium]